MGQLALLEIDVYFTLFILIFLSLAILICMGFLIKQLAFKKNSEVKYDKIDWIW
jgi:hypothetical protein